MSMMAPKHELSLIGVHLLDPSLAAFECSCGAVLYGDEATAHLNGDERLEKLLRTKRWAEYIKSGKRQAVR